MRIAQLRLSSVVMIASIVIANLVIWSYLNWPKAEVEWSGPVNGVSFSPFRSGQDPLKNQYPSEQEIEQDLKFLADKVHEVRVYSSSNGLEVVPRLAQRNNLRVTAGAWLDKNLVKNEVEIEGLLHNAQHYPNIGRLIVGNEAVLRGDLTIPQLGEYLARVRAATTLPVGTAEPWHVWIDNPELARHVDFIAIHLLPYWEGIDAEDAIGHALDRYWTVKAAFPDKPVIVGEVGWPSAGFRIDDAEAGLAHQARFTRQFLNIAQRQDIEYFLMEAFDQPWKIATEGKVGAHWGIFDANRASKFSFIGPITDNPFWPVEAVFATLLALVPMVWLLQTWRGIRSRGKLVYALLIQTSASAFAVTAALPITESFSTTSTLVWMVLLPAQLMLYAIVLANGFELVEMSWMRGFRRKFVPVAPRFARSRPKVSIHLAICNEPAHLVIQTLNSLAALDYPNFEVIVVDNNTKDPNTWLPVARHCERLGEAFKFFSLGKWPGFKAGALNFALEKTAADAQFIGVVDSDYLVRRDWLGALVPHFGRPEVGFVQAPQDHYDWHDDKFKEMCNWEYAGFFNIGMVHRNERDAIIQHGTMTIIRRTALEALNGWSEKCICEDSELGLRLMAQGYESVYVNEPFGRGLTPHSYESYKRQRFRWAYGAMQILRSHWRTLAGLDDSRMTMAQRYHFVAGWMPWFGDAMHVVFAYLAVIWSIGLVLLPGETGFPLWAFILPTFVMFGYKMVSSLWLYKRCVPCNRKQSFGAAVAGMALTHTIGYAILQGLVTSGKPFMRTPKSEDKPALWRGFSMAREEVTVLIGLIASANAVLGAYGWDHKEALMWAAILGVQSTPYLAAIALSFVNVLTSRAPVPVEVPATKAAHETQQPSPISISSAAASLRAEFGTEKKEAA